MKFPRKTLCTLAFLGMVIQGTAKQFLYLATRKDSALVSYEINPDSGALKKHYALKLQGTGGPMSLTRDGKYLYVESHLAIQGEKKPLPHVVSLKVDNGTFEQIHIARVRLRSPAIHVDNTGHNLLGAHYGEGMVSVWKIDEKHRCTGKLTDGLTTAPRAHFISTDPSNQFAYVPHTAPNAVYQFRLDAGKGKLLPLDPPFVEGPDKDHQYHEPRHYAHHPTLSKVYTSNERGGGISLWNFNSKTGQLKLEQTICTLPRGYDGNGAGADIHITPNGRFVYMSNRDNTRGEEEIQRRDTIAGYRIDPKTGLLSYIDNFPTEHAPRAFCIDRTGNFLFVAGQHVNKLAAYRIDPKSGRLQRIGTYPTGENPIWVTCWAE
jgi:6-phosphogluconolactonase